MKARHRRARQFLSEYEKNLAELEKAAEEIRSEICLILDLGGVRFHAVDCRVKSADSIRGKLLRKKYENPASEMTDLIGVRVTTLFSTDVDAAAAELRKKLNVIAKHSTDKRQDLRLQEFGYRSYHLVAKLRRKLNAGSNAGAAIKRRFEVQIRTLLEHVWAEIEHEAVYKAGFELPAEQKRRLAATAAVLEMADGEFSRLVSEKNRLLQSPATSDVSKGLGGGSLDLLSLSIALRRIFPPAAGSDSGFDLAVSGSGRLSLRLLLALRDLGIKRDSELLSRLDAHQSRVDRRKYADDAQIPMEKVSHVAALALLIRRADPGFFDLYFPELASDLRLQAATQ